MPKSLDKYHGKLAAAIDAVSGVIKKQTMMTSEVVKAANVGRAIGEDAIWALMQNRHVRLLPNSMLKWEGGESAKVKNRKTSYSSHIVSFSKDDMASLESIRSILVKDKSAISKKSIKLIDRILNETSIKK